MTAGQENHDVTHRDIALLLADAADEVEVGMAPVQAVVRGGRRRKTRRWAVGAAAALVIVSSTASLAVAELRGGDRNSVAPMATQSPTAEERDVRAPQRTLLARGTFRGKEWTVYLDVWVAPRDAAEAREQLTAMDEFEVRPTDAHKASELIGKSSYVVYRTFGDTVSRTFIDVFTKDDTMTGTDMQSGEFLLNAESDGPYGLVIGQVAKTAQRVTCTWNDGTTAEVRRAPEKDHVNSGEQAIRSSKGSPVDWFVCLIPEGKKGMKGKTAKVTG
ncbi:hypothetical protein [Streptomyces sp. NPDC012510]|uniref:hypothetical protein n=1 Tax=Streptomyces sp. NPDC012510 TaxID=3364838 RepID=UPI0036E0BEB3